jgi:hypothetical protein
MDLFGSTLGTAVADAGPRGDHQLDDFLEDPSGDAWLAPLDFPGSTGLLAAGGLGSLSPFHQQSMWKDAGGKAQQPALDHVMVGNGAIHHHTATAPIPVGGRAIPASPHHNPYLSTSLHSSADSVATFLAASLSDDEHLGEEVAAFGPSSFAQDTMVAPARPYAPLQPGAGYDVGSLLSPTPYFAHPHEQQQHGAFLVSNLLQQLHSAPANGAPPGRHTSGELTSDDDMMGELTAALGEFDTHAATVAEIATQRALQLQESFVNVNVSSFFPPTVHLDHLGDRDEFGGALFGSAVGGEDAYDPGISREHSPWGGASPRAHSTLLSEEESELQVGGACVAKDVYLL